VCAMPADLLAAATEVERQSGDVRQISMYSSSLVNPRGLPRAKELQPRPPSGRTFDPNDARYKNRPTDVAAMQSAVDNLLKTLGDPKKTQADRDAAWAGVPSTVKTMLADSMGIDSNNWASTVPGLRMLPRTETIKVLDESRKSQTSTVYENQTRLVTQSYQYQEPVYAPIGCGCQGLQLVGWNTLTGTRQVPTVVTVAVAQVTPITQIQTVMTLYNGTKQVPRQVTENYYDSEPVWGPIGCGCQGSQIVGYNQVQKSRQVTVYDTVAYSSWDEHAPQYFKKAGQPQYNGTAGTFFSGAEETDSRFHETTPGSGLFTRPTNDAGSPLFSNLDATGKGVDLASRNGNDEHGGQPLNNQTRAKNELSHP